MIDPEGIAKTFLHVYNYVIVASSFNFQDPNSQRCLSTQTLLKEMYFVCRAQTDVGVDGTLKLLQKLHSLLPLHRKEVISSLGSHGPLTKEARSSVSNFTGGIIAANFLEFYRYHRPIIFAVVDKGLIALS